MSSTKPGQGSAKPRPNPLRARLSCPDCGFIISWDAEDHSAVTAAKGFTCPRCQAHYSETDFWTEHKEKLQAMHHNHARADLSGEIEE